MDKGNMIFVVRENSRIPFLRGMLTHWLLARGFTFEDAYDLANTIRDQIRHRSEISVTELKALVLEAVRKSGRSLETPDKEPPVVISPIMVQGKDVNIPFSKGILSQSLQASGMSPEQAYHLAWGIEKYLTLQNRDVIHRQELLRITYRHVLKQSGPRMGNRYLLWRLLNISEKPIVILIGGATGVGKSTIAAEIAHRMGIVKVVGTDVIRHIMRGLISERLIPTLHTSSYEAGHSIHFPMAENSRPVIEGFKQQVINVCSGVEGVLQRIIIERENAILEGIHLVPGFLDLSQFRQQAHIVHLMISSLDQNALKNRFLYRQRGAPTRKMEGYLKNLPAILDIQEYILEQADHHSIPIIDNILLDQTTTDVLDLLSSILSRREEFRTGLQELKRESIGEPEA